MFVGTWLTCQLLSGMLAAPESVCISCVRVDDARLHQGVWFHSSRYKVSPGCFISAVVWSCRHKRGFDATSQCRSCADCPGVLLLHTVEVRLSRSSCGTICPLTAGCVLVLSTGTWKFSSATEKDQNPSEQLNNSDLILGDIRFHC